MAASTSDNKSSWLTWIGDEIAQCAKHDEDDHIPRILKDLLLDKIDPGQAAQKLDDYYWNTYLPSDPLMKYTEDKGAPTYLTSVYEYICDTARQLPYNDCLQDKMVQVIVELRKLPPKPFKIWGEDCMVYTTDPVYSVVMVENGSNMPTDAVQRQRARSSSEWEEICEEWLNFSTFSARCLGRGLDASSTDRCYYPNIYISKGLDEDDAPGSRKNCMVMAAAQFLLLAGHEIIDSLKGSSEGLEKLRRWAGKFQKYAEEEGDGLSAEVKLGCKEANAKMVSILPDLLSAS